MLAIVLSIFQFLLPVYAAVYEGEVYATSHPEFFAACLNRHVLGINRVGECMRGYFPYRVYLQSSCARKVLGKDPEFRTLIEQNEDGVWVDRELFSRIIREMESC